MPQVISANRLTDGTIVYLDQRDGWVEELSAARVLVTDHECQLGLEKAGAAVAANLIIEPLPVEIVDGPDGRRATTLRNTIRALGPTIKINASRPATAAARR